jgi:hypothetical protein
MPKHIVRLILLIGIALLGFLVVRELLVAQSHGVFGHYRGASVGEVAFPPPVIKTPAYCQGCHFDRHAEWRAAGHKTVMCETCHGPAVDHPAKGKLPIPQYTVSLCIACHEAKPARRRDFPQIVLQTHLAGTGTPQDCIACHNPHTLKMIKPGEGGEGKGKAEQKATDLQNATGQGAETDVGAMTRQPEEPSDGR